MDSALRKDTDLCERFGEKVLAYAFRSHWQRMYTSRQAMSPRLRFLRIVENNRNNCFDIHRIFTVLYSVHAQMQII